MTLLILLAIAKWVILTGGMHALREIVYLTTATRSRLRRLSSRAFNNRWAGDCGSGLLPIP